MVYGSGAAGLRSIGEIGEIGPPHLTALATSGLFCDPPPEDFGGQGGCCAIDDILTAGVAPANDEGPRLSGRFAFRWRRR